MNEALLVRTRKTAPQKDLGPDERLRNLRHAFAVTAEAPPTVILTDDIYTTGSTIEACTRVLKAAGACQVYFVSICIGGS